MFFGRKGSICMDKNAYKMKRRKKDTTLKGPFGIEALM